MEKRLKALNCCILIPTYNNAKTLKRVLDGCLSYSQDILVVNDGATDSTSEVLESYTELDVTHLAKNKGKGNALRIGFKRAIALGFQYVITIDSDGQHFPEDISVFVEKLEKSKNKNLLLIGARNMSQTDVPKKSSFGNKFSNFWFWIETGIKLEDTQSGYRLYPLKVIKDLTLKTNKFEFEIEVIVKAAWAGTHIENVPVRVLYDESERVSHFRPFKDFTRISILNTWFVIITIFYIKPRDFIRRLKKKGIKRFVVEDFLQSYDSPRKKAFSIALGVFMGLTPVWGFHTIIVIFLAILLRLNKVIAFAFSNISLPPFIPFVILMSLKTGNIVLGKKEILSFDDITGEFEIVEHLKTYIVGSLTLATISAVTFGFLGYFVLTIFNRRNQTKIA